MEKAQAYFNPKGLKVEQNPKQGRFIVALKDFSLGDTIHPFVEPFVSSLRGPRKNEFCYNCWQDKPNLLQCTACKFSRYCSPACQRESWKAIHSSECKAICKVAPNVPPPTLMLLLNFIRNMQRELKGQGVSPGGSVEDIQFLSSHKNAVAEGDMAMFAQMSMMAISMAGTADPNITPDLLIDVLLKFKSNNYNICNDQMDIIGVGLYPRLSLFNHSCDPNCAPIFEGTKMQLKAIRPIKAGEEVTISYIEIGQTTQHRKDELEENFFFECCCTRCTTPEPLPSKPQTQQPKITKKMEIVRQLQDEEQYEQLFQVFEDLLTETAALQEDSRSAYFSMNIYDQISKTCLTLQNWEIAKEALQKSLEICQQVYPPYWPMLGIQYYTLGKLHWFLFDNRAAEPHLLAAHQIFTKLHASNSPFLKQLTDLIVQLKLETNPEVPRIPRITDH